MIILTSDEGLFLNFDHVIYMDEMRIRIDPPAYRLEAIIGHPDEGGRDIMVVHEGSLEEMQRLKAEIAAHIFLNRTYAQIVINVSSLCREVQRKLKYGDVA